MYKVWCGIDNGVSGTIGILGPEYSDFMLTPVFKEQNYTKAKDLINRVNVKEFKAILQKALEANDCGPDECMIMLERPMVNPTRFKATCSALRCLEAELCVIEDLGIPHFYCDSKEWQKKWLPANLKGSEEQKQASKDVGIRLYPQHKTLIAKHGDADALFIAMLAKNKFN